ncbi:hypothetical protein F5Y15DRAFT_427633 [Xylariaceae sp. FL0016]|nr:hypothetical protein F5Y15DRAFT_427633 [Xylariaceae sp. FL0016]
MAYQEQTADEAHELRAATWSQDSLYYTEAPAESTEVFFEPFATDQYEESSRTSVPQQWPTSPRPIAPSWKTITADLTLDIILLGLSIAFLAFGLIVRRYDQAPTAAYPKVTSALVQATIYGPSVFPILFACVVGRATHATLIWRLERGERTGVLDLLAVSTSLTSTVTSQSQMRTVSLVGVALIVVWAMSPSANSTYMVSSGDLREYDESGRASSYAVVNSIFVSSLISPLKLRSSPVDTWGNVIIPFIESYENHSITDGDGWYRTNASLASLSSLVGLPIANITATYVDYSINIETRYFHLDCPVVYGAWVEPRSNYTNWYHGYDAMIWSNQSYDWERQQTNPDDMASPRWFHHQWWGSPTNMSSNCSITTTYVEADVTCATSSQCAVSRLRRSRAPHPPAAYTLIDSHPTNWAMYAYAFVSSFTGHPLSPTPVQRYLFDPETPFQWAFGDSDAGKVSKDMLPSNEVFAARLGQLMNTYWSCMNGMRVIPGGVTPSTVHMQGTNTSDPALRFLAKSTTTNGTRSTSETVMHCDRQWVAVLCIASIVIIIGSLINPILRYFFTTTPDLTLNISSLAMRDSPYVGLPASGSSLPAADRARLLKRMRVRFGDVAASNEVGRLAIASLEPWGEQHVAKARKGRLYE